MAKLSMKLLNSIREQATIYAWVKVGGMEYNDEEIIGLINRPSIEGWQESWHRSDVGFEDCNIVITVAATGEERTFAGEQALPEALEFLRGLV